MGVDRASLSRSGSTVSATVLMGTFEPEIAQGSTAQIQYYLSDETFDCATQSRVEHEVRVYSPDGTLLGTSPPDPDTSLLTGSAYYTIYESLCADDSRLQGGGHASALDAIRDEARKRQASGLAVTN